MDLKLSYVAKVIYLIEKRIKCIKEITKFGDVYENGVVEYTPRNGMKQQTLTQCFGKKGITLEGF